MDYYDIIDLAAELVKFELTDDNVDELEEEFFAKYEISLESFSKLVEDLIKFTPIIKSPLTETWFHAFVKELDNGVNMAIIKEEYEGVNKDLL